MKTVQTCKISEQIFDDPASELTFQFEVVNDGTARLHIFGHNLPSGNRTFSFDSNGELTGSGTATSGQSRPGWLMNLDDL